MKVTKNTGMILLALTLASMQANAHKLNQSIAGQTRYCSDEFDQVVEGAILGKANHQAPHEAPHAQTQDEFLQAALSAPVNVAALIKENCSPWATNNV